MKNFMRFEAIPSRLASAAWTESNREATATWLDHVGTVLREIGAALHNSGQVAIPAKLKSAWA